MNELAELEQQIQKTKFTLKQLQERADKIRSDLSKKVGYETHGKTITLTYNGRKLNANRNRHWRWDVSEKGKVIMRDYPLGIYGLRVELALGRI